MWPNGKLFLQARFCLTWTRRSRLATWIRSTAKHKSLLTKDGEEDEDTMSRPKIIIEDLGGAPADVDDEAHPEDATHGKHELSMPTSIITRVLARTAERDAAGQVGRPKDMHKEMQRVAAIFGTELDDIMKPFQV